MFRKLLNLLGLGRGTQRSYTAKSAYRSRSATGDVLAKGRNPEAGSGRSSRSGSESADFDPYNTGKFDRSASWERVRRSHR